MSFSLAKIQGFLAVAEAGQFRKAAERIGLSQAALSTQIRDLERQLGVALFTRTTRSVTLTAEGKRFFHRAEQIVADLDAAVAEIRDQATLRHGRLVIAATPTIASNLLPPALVAFRSLYPGIAVRIVEDWASGVERRVESGEADFGVGPHSERRTELTFSLIVRDQFVGVVPIGHKLAGRDRVRLDAFLAYPLLTTMPESSIRSSVEEILEPRGIKLRTDHTLMHHETVVAMVAAGFGVALLPSLALGSVDRKRVSLVNIVSPEIARDVGIMQRRGGNASAAVGEFLRRLSSVRK